MKLIIDISEEDYAETMYRKEHSPRDMDWADRVIANGTPLPKGHGRLGDLDIFLSQLVFGKLIDDLTCGKVKEIIKASTIIEADKERHE